MNEPVVQLENVHKSFGARVALKGFSMAIPAHTIFGLIGPNGSGKTTTLRLLLNIYRPDSGVVRVLGQEGMRLANDSIGYLPEERGLYRKMQVGTQLKYFARLKGMKGRDLDTAMHAWLERMGLGECLKMPIEQLSKGMAQKIQFITAVMFKPRLLILDEPFSGLDPVNLDLVNAVIHELRDSGVTIVLSTHDMPVAERLCDHVVMVRKGEKVLDGSIQSIRKKYGQDKIRLGFSGRRERIASIPGVAGIREVGRYWELSYQGCDQELLKRLLEEGSVTHFELAHPSLHDIFINMALDDHCHQFKTQTDTD